MPWQFSQTGGKASDAPAGKHATGLYPFGYAAGSKGRDRDAVPLDSEQQAVRRITELRSDMSYREIVTTLEAVVPLAQS